MARVDVLIPVYNAASTVESAVQSICAQTVRDIRLIVVDDGSSDDTPNLLRAMAALDERIHVITTHNGGIVDALNVALAMSDAPFIARHDADDLAFPDRLQKQLAFMEAQADCIAVGCNAFHIDVDGKRTGNVTDFKAVVVGDPYRYPSLEPYLLHPFLLARRHALVDAGGYRYLFHSEDTDLYWRLAGMGRLSNLTEALGEYRIHADSVSSQSILNGRISAVNSQLAALSERRRLDGQGDLIFSKEDLVRYQAAGDLPAILAIASEHLSVDERRFLETATVAKLLELSSYRPYRMTPTDLATIRQVIENNYSTMSPENRLYLVFRVILGRKRLARDWTEVRRLVPWRIMPRALLEAARHVPAYLQRVKNRLSTR